MTTADWVALVMVLALILYAWSGLADYGAGFWDLVAGGRQQGRRPRALIDTALTPVWEANHVWLVFLIVTCWTAFGEAFASIMTTLYVPLALAALGIVLRGANFALRKDAARAGGRHVAGWLFGAGALLTPFCLGAALGALLTARVPVGNAAGDPWSSWLNPTAIVVGLLAVALGAFVAAVYLQVEASTAGEPDLRGYFRRRAMVAGPVGFGLGIVALATLYGEQREMFDRLVQRGWPLFLVGVVALVASFVLAARGAVRGIRVVAAVGVAGLVGGWGVAQYPYLLPFSLTIADGAGAPATQRWLLIWSLIALVTVVPALLLLYVLDQRGRLGEDPATSAGERRG
jgi:cytochrome d ubiquinol oxidase subunit II